MVPLPHHPADHLPKLPAAVRVQTGRGFVQEQHGRVGHQGARQVEAAAHPAGVGLDRAAAGLNQIELLQQLGGAAARAAPAEVIEPADHVEVLEPGQMLVHRRKLSGQSDLAAHVARSPHHVGAGNQGAAGIRGDQGGQNGHGGGLARPVGAEHAEHRALRHGEVETCQGGDPGRTVWRARWLE